jgi:putative nucleotidyltransferase with HDIG domain
MGSFFGKSLLVDIDVKFIESIKKEEKLLIDYPCLFAKTSTEAVKLLKQSRHNIRIIFISSTIGSSQGLEEFAKFRKYSPEVPVILISHKPEFEPEALNESDTVFNKILITPKSYVVLIREMDQLFQSKETWTEVEASKEAKDVELQLSEEGYIPALMSEFILTPNSFFNVFVKIGQAKFIKILNAGDPLSEELIQTYQKKGMTHLHIPIDEHKKYIRFCEEMSKKTILNQNLGTIKKYSNVLNFGANIAQSLIHTGISQEKLDFANTFLSQSVTMIKGMRIKNESLKKFIASLELKEHTSTVSFLAGMIANEVGIESIKSIKLVGIAALLHDIGLYESDPNFEEHNLDLNEEQQNNFDKHQKRGAQILRDNGGFDEVIYQAVENHHMRRKGSDPARRLNNINMIAEIIGAADEIHNIIISKNADQASLNMFTLTNLKNFSPQIEKAVLKLLDKKKAA